MWAKMIPQPDEKSSYFRRKKIKIVHKKKKKSPWQNIKLEEYN